MLGNKRRYDWIVALRAIAALAVVLLHTAHRINGPENPGGGIFGVRWFVNCVLIDTFARFAVPTFVMITGFLLLNPNKEIGIRKTLKYVLRMGAVLLSIGYIYCLIESVLNIGTDHLPSLLISAFRNLLEEKSWAHMWYVYMLIGLYCLTPMLRIVTRHGDQRAIQFTLVVLFLMTILRNTINALTGMSIVPMIPITEPFLFYYLMGYYIQQYPIDKKICVSIVIIGLVCNIALLLSVLRYQPLLITESDNVFVMLFSVGTFALAKGNMFLEKLSKDRIISSISKYSFGIYLFHPFFLNLLTKGLHLYPDLLPIGVGEIAFFIFALLGSWITTWLLTRIKVFQWLLL